MSHAPRAAGNPTTHERQPMEAAICNPLDLAYRFQELRFLGLDRTVHREAADPSIVRYRDRFYLFASMTNGFWHSADLTEWTFQRSERLHALDYAPDVRVVDGALIVSASRTTDSPFLRTENPLADDFVEINPGFAFWDPHVFQDEDSRTYFYWGCSNNEPIRGVRVDPKTFDSVGEPVALLRGEPDDRGWERVGESYVKAEPKTERERIIAEYFGDAPYIEGAWMTKHDETYYLQYAAPGTEWNTYADGYVTGASPLGPFEYSPHSPFSSKPGGFITGAGHGSTFQDEYGNWWHASTMRISVHHAFERRIGIFPAGFDEDGVMFCNQNFGDYPMVVPHRKVDPWKDVFAGWMLQSYRADVQASSAVPGHEPQLAVDEDVRTWWVADDADEAQWLQVDLGGSPTVHAIQVNLADYRIADLAPETSDGLTTAEGYRGLYREDHPTGFILEVSADGDHWDGVADTRAAGVDSPHALITLETPRRVRFVRLTAGDMPFGGALAVSGLRVFGLGEGSKPPVVEARAIRRDPLTADVEWDPSEGAHGYNVRYGIHPEKLYHSWLVYDQLALTVGSLNAGHDYWVAVDAFNENGITVGEAVLITGRSS
jgi:hypothetical protein